MDIKTTRPNCHCYRKEDETDGNGFAIVNTDLNSGLNNSEERNNLKKLHFKLNQDSGINPTHINNIDDVNLDERVTELYIFPNSKIVEYGEVYDDKV